jgi:DNA-binding GntR family transcriptional regulator
MAPRLKTIVNENLGQRAYQELRSALADGRFHPGDRLRLRDLAEELGVSVTPIREAVLQLVRDGVLEMRTARDTRVRTLSPDEFAEIALIRQHLEGLAVEQFAAQMQPRHLSELTAINEKQQAALQRQDYRTAVALDRRFMFTIFEAVDMPILKETLDRLWLFARPTVSLLYSDEGAHRLKLNNDSLLTEFAAGNVKRAADARRAQIEESVAVIIEMLKELDLDDVAVNT